MRDKETISTSEARRKPGPATNPRLVSFGCAGSSRFQMRLPHPWGLDARVLRATATEVESVPLSAISVMSY
ncbi:MAG: hypothetical protein ISP88_05585 [Pseudomonadales bacterium]|nr:hypothetical protein [Pseudomonadales bacterium]